MSSSQVVFRFLIGLFISLLLMLLDQLTWLGWLRGGVEIMIRPQSRALNGLSQQLNTGFQTIRFVRSGPQRIADLERRLEVAQMQVIDINDVKQENQSMRKALGSSRISSFQLIPSKVLSVGQGLIIERSDGKVGEVVVHPDGIMIGVIDEVGRWSARVRRLSDSGSQVSVEVLSDGGDRITAGMLIGAYGGSAMIERVLTGVQLEPGQVVMTTGDDDVAPSGLLVGWITDQIEREESRVYQQARVELAVRLSELRTVFLIEWSP